MPDSVLPLTTVVAQAVSRAMTASLPAAVADSDPLVRRSDHADFQSNVALSLAKRLQQPPRAVAADMCEHLSDPAMTAPEVSGPGFVNMRLTDAALWSQLRRRVTTARLGVPETLAGQRIVIDYSSPNIAKQMHVGHLRTTVIGDALARVLGFLGAQIIRQNHLGDWGTQFGMLIQFIEEHPQDRWRSADLADNGEQASGTGSAEHSQSDDTEAPMVALDRMYRQARGKFDTDTAFAQRARARVVDLQRGDPHTLQIWSELVAESQRCFQAVYDRMAVLLQPADSAGESSYNPHLGEVVDELVAAGIAVDSDGALCVFSEQFTGPDGRAVPLIVRKSDGGYGYATTDLATLRYRVKDLSANTILYVVDSRQAQHFEMVFDTARRAGWLSDDVTAVHVTFGTVLGKDGKPFKTRAGTTIPLTELLDSAVQRARVVVAEKAPDMDPTTLAAVTEAVGIGAVKYADLSGSRIKDYVFDLDKMVSFTGNTGAYLQYAHARIRSILRHAAADTTNGTTANIHDDLRLETAERELILLLDEFGKTLTDVAAGYEPHRLAGYLYALAQAFTAFYEACPVLRAEDARLRGNRLALCELTGDTLRLGLQLLGIDAPERI